VKHTAKGITARGKVSKPPRNESEKNENRQSGERLTALKPKYQEEAARAVPPDNPKNQGRIETPTRWNFRLLPGSVPPPLMTK